MKLFPLLPKKLTHLACNSPSSLGASSRATYHPHPPHFCQYLLHSLPVPISSFSFGLRPCHAVFSCPLQQIILLI
jgi:hypothetical protein